MNNEKKKFNPLKSIPLCLCSLMFVASFALFAVSLALSLVDITAGGHISFTASCVNAKVTGTVTGTKTTNTLTNITLDESVENFTTPDSWKNMTLDFTNDNLITLTINVQNLSEENPLSVIFSSNLEATDAEDPTDTNIVTTETFDGSSINSTQVLEVPVNSTKTAVITLKVDNINKSVNADYSLNIRLYDEKNSVFDESVYTTEPHFSFTDYNDATKTVTINSLSGLEVIKIPSRVIHNNTIYTITKVGYFECYNLKTVTIPSTVTSLDQYAFGDPDSMCLEKIIFEDTKGWKQIKEDGSKVAVSETDLSDPTQACSLFFGGVFGHNGWIKE